MTTAVFTPTRHAGLSVTYNSIMKQTSLPKYWLVADQLDRQDLIFDKCKGKITPIYCRLPVKEGDAGNLETVSNWALQSARELDVDLLVFLQDYIWIPPDGIELFEKDAQHHPFALLTGRCDLASGPRATNVNDPWDIFPRPIDSFMRPPPPYEIDPRIQYGWKHGRITNHAWEINWGAMPRDVINCGVDFDEDYNQGVQYGNTDFSFNVLKYYSQYHSLNVLSRGYVHFNPNNHAYGLPHRDYFPKTHEGEFNKSNAELFWRKHPELIQKTS